MSKWIAQVTVAAAAPLGEQHLVTLDEAAERWDATVANRAEGPGFTVTIGLDEGDAITAARTAVQFLDTVLGEIATGRSSVFECAPRNSSRPKRCVPTSPRWPPLPTPLRSSGCPGSESTSWPLPTLGSRYRWPE